MANKTTKNKSEKKKIGLLKLLFSKRSEIKGDDTLVAFLQSANSYVFSALWLMLWILAIGFGYGIYINISTKQPILLNLLFFIVIAFSIFLAQIFRRISIEIEKLEDRDSQISLFSALITVMALIVSVIALKI